MPLRWLLVAFAIPLAADQLATIPGEIQKIAVDPESCFRVRDLSFSRGDDLRFYLNDGYLIFGKPVAGRRISAVFVGDDEGGDAELIVMPPTKGERLSLASFTGQPNLNEHFRQAVFLFTDDTGDLLLNEIRQRDMPRRAERGAIAARDWDVTLQNLARSFIVRLTQQLAANTPTDRGFVYAALQGRKLGNFDVYYDPEAANQIYVGALRTREDRIFYDTWTNFEARPFRAGARKPPAAEYTFGNYRIQAVLEENLHLRVVSQATLTVARDNLRLVAFEITQGMKVGAVRINGETAELFSPESLRSNLLRNTGSTTILVEAPQPLTSGRAYEIEFEHEGDIVRNAGRNVFFVGARSNWYPRAGGSFATYDTTFTYPSSLQIVFPGALKEDKTEGNQRTTRRVTGEPIRLLGFNLGQYESSKVSRAGLTVEVFANKQAEPNLGRAREVVVMPPQPPFPRRSNQQTGVMALPAPPPNPLSRVETIAIDIAGAFDFLNTQLGPPATPTLMVSPIPGAFGQGFPGLVYLSTWSYINASERPAAIRDSQHEIFFSELLHAHETAHQWWGNVVTSASAQDDWLMEALANYSSLLLYEKKKGAKAMQQLLEHYRARLLEKDDSGKAVDSVGPIRLGPRLQSSLSPDAWHTIVYGKGSWIIHMLRRRLGDEQFFALLGEFCKRYRHQAVTIKQFQELAAAHLPRGSADSKLDAFFEAWVEATGIPELKLESEVKGRAPNLQLNLKLTQTEVDESVSLQVPVEVQVARGKSQMVYLTTGGAEPATATVPLRAAPLKVTLDPELTVLRR